MYEPSKTARAHVRALRSGRRGGDHSPEQELAGAILRLVITGNGRLAETLLLIAGNGNNRQTSINRLAADSKSLNAARKKYFSHRDRLLNFFFG